MAIRKLIDAKVITAALTGGTIYTSPVLYLPQPVLSVALAGVLIYGSGGTSIDAYVQTSLDGGSSWCDVANFHFTTQNANKLVNLSALTPVTSQYAPGDMTMTNDTVKDGLIGHHWRAKVKSSGTYGGNTRLTVAASFKSSLIS